MFTNSNSTRRRLQDRKRYQFETLEPKHLLTSLPWNNGAGISLSFAADGVDIAGEPNQLVSTLDAAFPDDDWQATILSGFQRWAAQANTNIALVEEFGGFEFGTEGARVNDARFGQIRIGARPLSSNIKALSIPSSSLLSGTWAGDVIFNSNAPFESLETLLAVAAHEAGHVFGLPNSDASDSVMNSRSPQLNTDPSPSDISALRGFYDDRLPDEFDFQSSNDQWFLATPVVGEFASPVGLPQLVFGDVGESDVDYYRFTVPEWRTEATLVRVQTEGISLLAPDVTVLDANRNVIAHQVSRSVRGDTIEIEVDSQNLGGELYVRVSSARDDEFATGSYVAQVFSSDVPSVEQDIYSELAWLFPIIGPDEALAFLGGDAGFFDEEPIFFPGEFEVDAEFENYDIVAGVEQFRHVGSYGNYFDTDTIAVPILDFGEHTTVQAYVQPLEPGGLVPTIEFVDGEGRVIESKMLVNDQSEQLIQVPFSALDPVSYVRVLPPSGGPTNARGNYVMTVQFHSDETSLDDFVEDQLSTQDRQKSHPFSIPTSEFNHFSLKLTGPSGGATALIRDSKGNVIRAIGSAVGETHTVSGVFLPAGDYEVTVVAAPNLPNATYSLTRSVVSDPFGVTITRPTDLDFSCPNVSGAYCYPGGIESSRPGLWDDFVDDHPTDKDVPPKDQPEVYLGPWWNWYWNETQPNKNSPPLPIKDGYESNTGQMLSVDPTSGVLGNDVDPNNDDVSASIVRQPSQGRIELNSDGSFVYRPFPGFVGKDAFDYRISDGTHESQIATVSLNITTPVKSGDYDADGKLTAIDVDIVAAAVRVGTDIRFDLDESGAVDLGDLKYMVRSVANSRIGDSNLDGDIDGIDLNVVGKNWLKAVQKWSEGDFNGDGVVDAIDLNMLGQNWARQTPRAPRAALAQQATPPTANDTIRVTSAAEESKSPAAKTDDLPSEGPSETIPRRRVAAQLPRRRSRSAEARSSMPQPSSEPIRVVGPLVVDAALRSW